MSLRLLPLSAEAELIIDNHRDLRRLAALGPMTFNARARPLVIHCTMYYISHYLNLCTKAGEFSFHLLLRLF